MLTGGVLETGLATTLLIRGTLSHLQLICPSILLTEPIDCLMLCFRTLLTLKGAKLGSITHARSTVQGSYCELSRLFRDQLRPVPVKRVLLQTSTSNYWSCPADSASMLLQEQRRQLIFPQQPCSHWYPFASSLFLCLTSSAHMTATGMMCLQAFYCGYLLQVHALPGSFKIIDMPSP